MKHFIVEIIYKASIESIEETRPEHREFLKKGYDSGMLLMSGPQVPKIGGIVIAKADLMETLTDFFKNDPYQRRNLAEYRFIEFSPISHQEFLKEWLEK